MSEKKKSLGRGRGQKNTRSEGPWSRSTTLDEASNVRRPKKEEKETATKPGFKLQKDQFPPLPSSSVTENNNGPAEEDTSEGPALDSSRTVGNIKLEELSLKSNGLNQEDCSINNKNIQSESSIKLDMSKADSFSEDTEQEDPHIEHELPTVVSNLSPFAKEFIPKNSPTTNNGVPDATCEDSKNEEEEDANNLAILFADVEETVRFCYNTITEKPGQFDELIEIVKEQFVNYLKHEELTMAVVDMLYQFALNDVAFSYHAMRLLMFLIDLSSKELKSNNLREKVLKMAQSEAEITLNSRLGCPDMTPIVKAFILFLSELYIQFEVGGSRLCLIGREVVNLLDKFINTDVIPIKERLLSAVNMLKLTGTFLDQDDPTILKNFVQGLQNKLALERENLDTNVIDMVANVVQLRNNNWKESENVEPCGDQDQGLNSDGHFAQVPHNRGVFMSPMYAVYTDGLQQCHMVQNQSMNAVFYGPDGTVIPYEEQVFLECNASSFGAYEQQSEPSPSPMDDEMLEAYDEFLLTVPERH